MSLVAVGLPGLAGLTVEESVVPEVKGLPFDMSNGKATNTVAAATRKNDRRCACPTNRDVSLEATYFCPVFVDSSAL